MLSDLDELTLSCRSLRSRQHLNEAIVCYKAGAYRACIVATWTAVTFDLIDKFTELALAGDAEAKRIVDRFESARASADVRAALEFERGLLEAARKVDLVSIVELVDLERISEDRNRCAHPSVLVDGEVFVVPAELARLHVRNAVHHVMAQEPAQGKAALELLIRELQSDYFPRALNEVRAYLKASALRKPKVALLSNFVAVVLKHFLLNSDEAKGHAKYINALKVVKELHPAGWQISLDAHLSKSAARCETPAQMSRVLQLLSYFGADAYEALGDAQRIRIGTYIETLPSEYLVILKDLNIAEIEARICVRIQTLRTQDLRLVSPFDMVPSAVFERCIVLLRNAPGSQSAAEVVQFLIDHADELSATFVSQFLIAVEQTQAIRRCSDRVVLYEELLLRDDQDAEEIRQLVMLSDDYLRFYEKPA